MDRPERMFAFRLALALGYSHPDHLLASLTSRQFGEWLEYYNLQPFGEDRADLRAAIVACVMSNRWRSKHEQPREPMDFMPFARQKRQEPEEIKRTLRSILDQVKAMPHGKSRNNKH